MGCLKRNCWVIKSLIKSTHLMWSYYLISTQNPRGPAISRGQGSAGGAEPGSDHHSGGSPSSEGHRSLPGCPGRQPSHHPSEDNGQREATQTTLHQEMVLRFDSLSVTCGHEVDYANKENCSAQILSIILSICFIYVYNLSKIYFINNYLVFWLFKTIQNYILHVRVKSWPWCVNVSLIGLSSYSVEYVFPVSPSSQTALSELSRVVSSKVTGGGESLLIEYSFHAKLICLNFYR